MYNGESSVADDDPYSELFLGAEPMGTSSRREFLADVGRGMLIAGLGPALTVDLGLARAVAGEPEPARLNFGALEPLVALNARDAAEPAVACACREVPGRDHPAHPDRGRRPSQRPELRRARLHRFSYDHGP